MLGSFKNAMLVKGGLDQDIRRTDEQRSLVES